MKSVDFHWVLPTFVIQIFNQFTGHKLRTMEWSFSSEKSTQVVRFFFLKLKGCEKLFPFCFFSIIVLKIGICIEIAR